MVTIPSTLISLQTRMSSAILDLVMAVRSAERLTQTPDVIEARHHLEQGLLFLRRAELALRQAEEESDE